MGPAGTRKMDLSLSVEGGSIGNFRQFQEPRIRILPLSSEDRVGSLWTLDNELKNNHLDQRNSVADYPCKKVK